MNSQKKYDVFISSKSEDYPIAEKVYNFLVANGLTVFLASKELNHIGEAEYSEAVDAAIDATHHMIVVTTSIKNITSKWVKYEWTTFANELRSNYKEGNLLTILGPNVQSKDLPITLRHKQSFTVESYKDTILDYLYKDKRSDDLEAHLHTDRKVPDPDPSKRWLWIILVVAAMILIGGGIYLATNKSTTTAPTTTPTPTTQTQTQDSLAKVLQAEADRLAQERAQLEADKIKLQQSKPTVTAQPKPTTTTTQTSTSNPNTSTGQRSTTTPTTQAKPTTTSTPNKANAVAIHNGHKYVDLGLSIMWATTNIGANSSDLEGKYFAWGEVNAKQEYTWNTYRHCATGPYDFTKYCKKTNAYDGDFIDNKSRLELADDAANVHWGGEWRMPTATEMKELVQKCKWQCVTRNGVKGQLGTGPNGNTIFLPITGMYSGANKMSAGYQGAYWSSTLDEPFITYAIHMYVNEIQPNTAEKERYVGANIRPVLSRKAIDDLSNY